MERLYVDNAERTIKASLLNYEKKSYYLIGDTPIAFVGEEDNIDKEYCQRHRIKIINLGYKGGIIIGDTDDINICLIVQDLREQTFNTIYASLKKCLENKGLSVSLDGNDMMIDGVYKVASYSVTKVDFNYLCVLHISENVDTNYIKLLCKKPMVKIPRGLASYGITKNELLGVLGIGYNE